MASLNLLSTFSQPSLNPLSTSSQGGTKRRQAIVEHSYGTIKRQWGCRFSYITTKKGKQRASADVGLMFTAYNFRQWSDRDDDCSPHSVFEDC